MTGIYDKFEDDILFTARELDINVVIEDEQAIVYCGDLDVTSCFTDDELGELRDEWVEAKSQKDQDDAADRADWEYEQHKDRQLDRMWEESQ